MAVEVFNRHENKYLIDEETYRAVCDELSARMKLDKHNKNGEMYSIRNLYYDTDDYNLIRTSLEKPTYKEKVRMRSYTPTKDDDIVYVEIKKKYDGLVNKRRTAMKFSEAKQFLKGEKVNPKTHTNPQVARELTEIIGRRKLSPKALICYDRMAFFDREDDDLRVSFDHNVRTFRGVENFECDIGGKKILPDDKYLMEIKVRWVMPLWLVDILNKYQIRRIGFSKYGTEYVNKLKEECA